MYTFQEVVRMNKNSAVVNQSPLRMSQSSMSMNQNSWIKMKQRIQSKWVKLSEAQIAPLRSDLSLLKKVLQASYGYAPAAAKDEFDEFIAETIFSQQPSRELHTV
jgi:hypothetical protein